MIFSILTLKKTDIKLKKAYIFRYFQYLRKNIEILFITFDKIS